MKRHVALLAGLAGILVACDGTSPTAPDTASLAPSFAASTSTSTIIVDDSFTNFVSCANGGAGETVTVSGKLHVLFHTTISSSGNIVGKFHYQPQGMKGVGDITGDTYHATGVSQQTTHGTGTFTYVNNYRFIGEGPRNNLQIHQNVHVTVNANGDVTATVDNSRLVCQ